MFIRLIFYKKIEGVTNCWENPRNLEFKMRSLQNDEFISKIYKVSRTHTKNLTGRTDKGKPANNINT